MTAYSTNTFVIETNEENPTQIAQISEGKIDVLDGFVVRPLSGDEIYENLISNAERYDSYYVNRRLGKSRRSGNKSDHTQP